jgi:4-amino-4-deoxy-L-arabinose transferase-like glycosyltransferase
VGRSGGYIGEASSGANLSGTPGWMRLFNTQLGGQISWLLPLAILGLVAGLYATFRLPRSDKRRAGYVMWGLWTLVMAAVFSFATGTLHSYYVIIMAPGVAALAGAGAVELWRLGRSSRWLSWPLPAGVLGSAFWSAALVGRVSGYAPGLATTIVVLGSLAALALLVYLSGALKHRYLAHGAAAFAIVALLAGPTAYSLSTISRSVTGNTASAGPVTGSSATTDAEIDQALLSYLESNQGSAVYLVAVQGTAVSVPIILATGEPVVTIGGYKQRDPAPTVAELKAMVAAGELKYALVTDNSSDETKTTAGESSGTTTDVAEWIIAHGQIIGADLYGGTSTDDATLYYLQ